MGKPNRITLSIILFILINAGSLLTAQEISSESTLDALKLANTYYLNKQPGDMAADASVFSNTGIHSIYYEGLMAFYSISDDSASLVRLISSGNANKWDLPRGAKTRNAADQSCGQTYIDLYLLDRYKEERINSIRSCIDTMLLSDEPDEWKTTDDIQMAMPVFAGLGKVYMKEHYFERMDEMYEFTKSKLGGSGLYNEDDHLWWRDTSFRAPYREPGGENCYWSRGNGYIVAALVKSIEYITKNNSYKKSYMKTLKEMIEALVPLQRSDGFWNVSLKDPSHFGGKEETGTALFVYGIAWAINNGELNKKDYLPVLTRAWNALVTESLHPDGFIGYVQGPGDGQPVEYDKDSGVEDLAVGCFLLAGSEVYKLAKSLEPKEKKAKEPKQKQSSHIPGDRIPGRGDHMKGRGYTGRMGYPGR
jgi:unsaturated rhamnogalacturonyl hydrolase